MLYALLGVLVIVVVLAASALSLFLHRRETSSGLALPESPDAEGTSR